MADIYDAFDKATAGIQAFAILDKLGGFVGRAVITCGKTGAVTCYLQVWGLQMVKGRATGFGYDKWSAATESAAARLNAADGSDPEALRHAETIKAALAESSGNRWSVRLESAGYRVLTVA